MTTRCCNALRCPTFRSTAERRPEKESALSFASCEMLSSSLLMSISRRQPKRMRSRAKTLALLCLVAHSLFVMTTHHHRADTWPSTAVIDSMDSKGGNDSGRPIGANSDVDCLSCRLQHNFVSDLYTASLVVEPLATSLSFETFTPDRPSRGVRLLLPSRAPPLV
jgi:hypothetical protein